MKSKRDCLSEKNIGKEELIKALKKHKIAHISKLYGVSEYFITKKIKEYQIPVDVIRPQLEEQLVSALNMLHFKNSLIAKIFRCSTQNIQNYKVAKHLTDNERVFVDKENLKILLKNQFKMAQIAEILEISRGQLSKFISENQDLKCIVDSRNPRELKNLTDDEILYYRRKIKLHRLYNKKSTL